MASALIDTNLLLLLVVGATNKKYISTHKRTNIFSERDYDELLLQLQYFDSLWITSHCLAEASNLLKQTNEKDWKEISSMLSKLCLNYSESHISKTDIFASEHYPLLGVADTGFIQKTKRVTCSFTVDFKLYEAISKLGRKVINFNHIRNKYLSPF